VVDRGRVNNMSGSAAWPVRQSVLAICARANDLLTLVCVLRWVITRVRIIHYGTLQQSATEQSKTAIDHESEAPESTTTASSADEVGPTEKHDKEDGEDDDDEDGKKHRKVKRDDDDDDDEQALYEDTDDTVRQGQEVTQAISRVTDTAIFASITLPHLQFISFSFRYVIL